MKVLNVNLRELAEMLFKEVEAERRYAIAVIDNSLVSWHQLPLIGKNFIWIRKTESIPTERKELEELFSRYGIKVERDQSIAVFHHHDFHKSYLQFEEKVECYEFSHSSSVSYQSFCHADANLLSHMLNRTFHKYDKVILMKEALSPKEIKELQSKYWIFEDFCGKKLEGFTKEESLLYYLALALAGGNIVPDPKRYRPEVHNELIKAGVPVDQYAIPAMFKEVEIQTGTKLDEEVAREMLKRKKNWRKEIKILKKKREFELARLAQEEEELKKCGELLPEEARNYVDSIAPSLGYDYTDQPVYPPTRKDIAVVRRSVENGSSYGYDIIYLVWRVGDEIRAKTLIDSCSTKDYIHIRAVAETGNGIKIEVGSGGSYSGKAWDKTFEISFNELFGFGGKTKKPRNEFQRLSQGAAQVDFVPDAAKQFMKAMAEQMARLGMAASGKKTKGEERLEEFSKEMEKLKKKHPNLSEVSRLATIAEVYPDQLVRETFSLLKMIDDDRIANESLHILGEMAMLGNNPSLYLRLVNLLKKIKKTEQRRVLSDSRLEFKPDEIIESALKDYESLLV